MESQKISFCTVCMGRAHHIEATLNRNIIDNQDFPNLEFILLDYNSNDHLEDFVKDNMRCYIEQGNLVYYKTTEPSFFDRSHSRNLAFKLATGNVLCNIDADNYVGLGFASYINKVLREHTDVYLSPSGKSASDFLGRLCISKNDFFSVGGYDESIQSYGFEDIDLGRRLQKHGLKHHVIDEYAGFLDAIKHEMHERVSNEYTYKNLYLALVQHKSVFSSEVYILYKDHFYESNLLIDHNTVNAEDCLSELAKNDHYENENADLRSLSVNDQQGLKFQNASWSKGTWEQTDGCITFQNHQMVLEPCFTKGNNTHFRNIFGRNLYLIISEQEILSKLIVLKSLLENRAKMKTNTTGDRRVNASGFGQGKVFKNFDYENEITIK